MRPIRKTTLALATLTLLLAGCGTEAGNGKGGGGDRVSPSSPTPTATGCTTRAELGATDSGDTVCLTVGDTIRISLDGTKSRPWKPVAVDGSGLEATNSGIVLLPGDASSAYKAVSAGQVRLSSQRPLCATETGRVSCKGIQEWWVAVEVK
ncbi:hypothetical protein OG806_31680 [Streptomyces sp. NBC_00882]|uniref:hypothetical protein n=1 Tax=Streptomyces TaxID=1883 RepID=UPI00386BC03F|nr:hypothetical protein OH837_15925 [Streptomyces canus]WSZ33672.1 hypothetical protein OG806_31680 [Streptomyces sp. NBC_00882]WSZ60624.1 hypothetical protein OH824_30760 [Streptomyces canus]